jgi:hypothetical protein
MKYAFLTFSEPDIKGMEAGCFISEGVLLF